MNITAKDIDTKAIFSNFKKRDKDSHKGTYGRALLICGSFGMAGAAVLCAKSAVLSGVGIAEVICPKSIYPIISASVPEAVFTPVDDNPSSADCKNIINSIKKADSIVIGCGMGQSDYTNKLLYLTLNHSKVPTIIDADGINCIAHNIELIDNASCDIIITPHPFEMSRISGTALLDIQKNRIDQAFNFAKQHNITVVLKGHNTVIANSKNISINHTGNAGMATAGSGDMLSGIMAAFLAQNMGVFQSAESAVHIHGICGDKSRDKYSETSTTPTSMIEMLPFVFKEIEQLWKD